MNRIAKVLLLTTLALSIFALSTHPAWAAPTPISTCKRLTVRGPYVLTNNITATTATMTPTWASGYVGCIVIAADKVTVDMAGYVITGITGNTMGIAQDSIVRKGDVVRSGSVTNFSFGVAFAGSGHTIQGVNASNNGTTGIYVNDLGNRIIGNTANNNFFGIHANTCPNLLLENLATGNPNGDITEVGACGNRQENVPAP